MHSTTFLSLIFSAIIALASPVNRIDPSMYVIASRYLVSALSTDTLISACGSLTLSNETNFHTPGAEALVPRELPDAGSRVKVHWHVIMRDNTAAGGNIE